MKKQKSKLKNIPFKYMTGIFLTFILVLVSIVTFWIYTSWTEPKDPGFTLLENDNASLDEYYQTCPISEYAGEIMGESFKDTAVFCSENPYHHLSEKGEEVEITITSPDEDTGILEFKDWLQTNNLKESSKLRVKYIHDPIK